MYNDLHSTFFIFGLGTLAVWRDQLDSMILKVCQPKWFCVILCYPRPL